MAKERKFKTYAPHRDIRIGQLIKHKKAIIHHTAKLDITGNIQMEKYAVISSDVRILTHIHKWNHSRGRRKKIGKIILVNLIIGEDAFIGIRSIILAIVSIGRGAVIGAGSVVTKDIPAYEVWAGNPAKKIGERKDSD